MILKCDEAGAVAEAACKIVEAAEMLCSEWWTIKSMRTHVELASTEEEAEGWKEGEHLALQRMAEARETLRLALESFKAAEADAL